MDTHASQSKPQTNPPKTSFLTKLKPLSMYIVIDAILLLVVASGAYGIILLSSKKQKAVQKQEVARKPSASPTEEPPALEQTTGEAPTSTPIVVPTIAYITSWNIFTNSQYSYSIQYPSDWKVLNKGTLEPKIPSYIIFNPDTATDSARAVSIASTSRTYSEQLALVSGNGTAITVDGVKGTRQELKDSQGNQRVRVVLPTSPYVFVLDTKTEFEGTFLQMLRTFKLTR